MASIAQQPAQVALTGVAGSPFTLTLNVTATDSDDNPIPFSDFSDPSVVIFGALGPGPAGAIPTPTSPSSGVYQVAWTPEMTGNLVMGGPFAWAFSCFIEGVGPFFLVSGSIVMAPPTKPGGSTSTTQALSVFVGTATVDVSISLGGSGGAGGAVDSVFGRTGAVVAQSGDYTAGEVGADVAGAAATAQSNAETFATNAVATETTRAETAEALLAPKASPALTGTPTAPTAAPATNTTQVATTAFVEAAVAGGTAGVASFNGRTGIVVPTTGDYTVGEVTGAAPLASPALTGAPTAPTETALDNTTKIATTAYTDAAVGVETSRATTAEALKAPLASPHLTGVPIAPTASALTNTTQLATTAYADTAVGVETSRAEAAEALLAPLISPALTGTPTAPTKAALTNNTDIATTAYADAAVGVETTRATTAEGLLAPKASPALTGTPTAPTAAPATNTTQLATTAFVEAAVAGAGVSSFNTRTGAVTLAAGDVEGLFTAANQIIAGTGSGTGALTPLLTAVAAVSFPLIAYHQYTPVSNSSINGTVDLSILDATNLVVALTVPASGKVLVRLSGMVSGGTINDRIWWALYSGGTTKQGPTTQVFSSPTTTPAICSAVLLVSGLTAGTSLTLEWAAASTATNDKVILLGDPGGTLSAAPVGAFGPATMEVFAA